MSSLKDELRSWLGRPRLSKTKEQVFQEARAILLEKAKSGHYAAVILTVAEFEEELIDREDFRYVPYNFEYEGQSDRAERLEKYDIKRLRGVAAELRDYLVHEGLSLTLRHRTAGWPIYSGRHSLYNTWDLIAHW